MRSVELIRDGRPRGRQHTLSPAAGPCHGWVTAIEAGRGVAFVIPVEGLPPAEVLIAWRSDRAEPLVLALVASAEPALRTRPVT